MLASSEDEQMEKCDGTASAKNESAWETDDSYAKSN